MGLGLADTPENRQIAEQKVHQIEQDIRTGCFDETLAKYKPHRHLSIVKPEEPYTVLTRNYGIGILTASVKL